MSIKNDKLYPIYVSYLERKNFSKGAFTLAKISEQFFLEFKNEYLNSDGFRDKQDNLFKNDVRDIKIDDILHDETNDIDDFLNNL